MRKLLMVAAVALLPVAAHAQFSLGLRLGFAPAMGDAVKDGPLSDLVSSQIPVQLDAMYKVTPDLSIGGYLSYGFGRLNGDVSDFCKASGVDCSVSTTRIGAQLAYGFNKVSPTFFPWVGAGIGYEWLTQEVSLNGVSASQDAGGFEFLNLQAGGDFTVNERFVVGPYVQLSLGQYSSIAGNDIQDKAMHEWLGFGIRGKFEL